MSPKSDQINHLSKIREQLAEYDYTGPKPNELLKQLISIVDSSDFDESAATFINQLNNLKWPVSRISSSDPNHNICNHEKRMNYRKSILDLIDSILKELNEQ